MSTDYGCDTTYIHDYGNDDTSDGTHENPFKTIEGASKFRKEGRALIVRCDSAWVACFDEDGKEPDKELLLSAYGFYQSMPKKEIK